ncbi:MAG: hypothetical protein QOG34_2541 [Frankiaceae bacterium]|nr:hypothetical protein [Frankiaceae bacterium]
MSAPPVLVACLVALRAEFNEQYPGRDKGADGWIGDKAHQQESSDHNPDESGRTPYEDADHVDEVHALDVDSNLKPGAAGPAALKMDVERIRVAHRDGHDDRLQNVIYQGRICSRSWGWTWRLYTGASKHFDHAHFSARYDTSRENNTKPWGVKTVGVDLNANPGNVDAVYSGVNKANTLTRYDVGTAPAFAVTPSSGNVYGIAGGVSTAQRDAAYARSLGEQNKLKLATMEATLNNCFALLTQLTADAADTPNVIVDDVRYAIANP